MTKSLWPYTILRIEADPADRPFGPSWRSAATRAPDITAERRDAIIALAPEVSTPARVHVSSNHQAWDSVSDYLLEVARDEAACFLQNCCGAEGIWLENGADYEMAMARDWERHKSLFQWRRPLLRVATYVHISGAEVDADELASRVAIAIAPCVRTDAARGCGLLLAGSPQDLDQRLHQYAFPKEDPVRPW